MWLPLLVSAPDHYAPAPTAAEGAVDGGNIEVTGLLSGSPVRGILQWDVVGFPVLKGKYAPIAHCSARSEEGFN